MSNELALQDDMFSDARVQMIKDQVAKGAPDFIFAAMIDIAKRRRLDPLAKQISLIKFGGTWTIITTIDGYRALAEQTGQYAGQDAPVFTYADPPTMTNAKKKAPESATITVHKMLNEMVLPFSATVYWEEYSTGTNNWSSMPRTMLAKVAESHALRKAFPAVMSGLYTSEEMDQAVEGTAREVIEHVNRQTGEIQPAAVKKTEYKPPRGALIPPKIHEANQRLAQGAHVPPKDVEYYDALKDPMPEARAAIVQRYVLALQDAKMDENHRHAIAWAAGYGGTTTNVPSDVLEKWTRGIKSKPQLWKQTAEMRMVDMQAEQEQLNFQESAEYMDEPTDEELLDINPHEDDYEGEYEEIESE